MQYFCPFVELIEQEDRNSKMIQLKGSLLDIV